MTHPFFERPPVAIIQNRKAKSEMLAEAVTARGGLILREPAELPKGYSPVVIGAWPTTVQWLHRFRREQVPYLYIDNGYFRPYREGGYFRATLNALQYVGSEAPEVSAEEWAHWRSLGVEVKRFRPHGSKAPILLALQTPQWFDMMGISRSAWVRHTLARIEALTEREVRIREKPRTGGSVSLLVDLEDCSAVVAYSSATLLHAAAEGLPTFALAACAATPLSVQLAYIDAPYRPPFREAIFAKLAAQQWTAEEIAQGDMWSDLADRPFPPHRDLA